MVPPTGVEPVTSTFEALRAIHHTQEAWYPAQDLNPFPKDVGFRCFHHTRRAYHFGVLSWYLWQYILNPIKVITATPTQNITAIHRSSDTGNLDGTRTHDLNLRRIALYPLSYEVAC
jgi:hypothetical protein